jgi:hypothetical protein
LSIHIFSSYRAHLSFLFPQSSLPLIHLNLIHTEPMSLLDLLELLARRRHGGAFHADTRHGEEEARRRGALAHRWWAQSRGFLSALAYPTAARRLDGREGTAELHKLVH